MFIFWGEPKPSQGAKHKNASSRGQKAWRSPSRGFPHKGDPEELQHCVIRNDKLKIELFNLLNLEREVHFSWH